jgi:hypothetical protein
MRLVASLAASFSARFLASLSTSFATSCAASKAWIVLLTTIVIGCGGGGKKAEPPPVPAVQFPDWVNTGSGAAKGDRGRVLRGVGAASGIKNVALARTAADNRARAEIAKIMETYSASLMKDYMASTTAGDMKSSSEEQHVEQAVKTFSAVTLSGVQIVNHWVHPQDGTWYALAELDMTTMADNIAKAKQLSAGVRDYVRKNADRVHDDLEKEENKRSGREQAPAAAPPPASKPPAAAEPPAAAPPSQAEKPAVETPFGSTGKIEGALRGRIYFLPEDTSQLPDFSTLKPVGEVYATKIDVPSRSFDTGFPGITDRYEWFALRYDGDFRVDKAGSYGFRVESDDGSKLYIDGKLVIDNDGVHPPTSAEGTVQLAAGTHKLELEYFQGPRFYIAVQLFVTPPGGHEQIFETGPAAGPARR